MIKIGNIALFISIVFLFACTKDNVSDASNELLLLKIDFTSYQFEGGRVLHCKGDLTNGDTIPISVEYDPPGDFGNIKLLYQPSDELVFDASIIWMGTGEINYPDYFSPPNQFEETSIEIEYPGESNFQDIFNVNPVDYAQIWDAINNLQVVSDYLKSGKKVGLFLYTPSVGIGNPAEWDWFVIMNKAH